MWYYLFHIRGRYSILDNLNYTLYCFILDGTEDWKNILKPLEQTEVLKKKTFPTILPSITDNREQIFFLKKLIF